MGENCSASSRLIVHKDIKKELLERVPEVFVRKNAKKDQAPLKDKERLERKVGQLTMEVDWLEKKCVQLGIPGRGRSS